MSELARMGMVYVLTATICLGAWEFFHRRLP